MSRGILGPVQKQAIAIVKARLPDDELVVRKHSAGQNGRERPELYIGGTGDLDPEIMSVYPNELVFTRRTVSSDQMSMRQFIIDHPVHGNQFVTGDIHVKGFSAFNGLSIDEVKETDTIVYVGLATGSEVNGRGISGFAIQVTGSATINNAGPGYICAGDWVVWTPPVMRGSTPHYTVAGIPRQKALACVKSWSVLDLIGDREYLDDSGNFNLEKDPSARIIGRALTSATTSQEFDISLHT